MLKPNASLFFDISLLLPAIFYILRIGYLRSRRESEMRKYKLGTASYDSLKRMLSVRTLVLAIAITLLVIVKTVFDVRAAVDMYGRSALGHLLLMLAFGGLIFSVVLYVIYDISKRADGNQQDKDK
jgi:hypothetical protein